nr:SHOCT domain-containing protein [Candidatus Njordarchaeum guaymaensis]
MSRIKYAVGVGCFLYLAKPDLVVATVRTKIVIRRKDRARSQQAISPSRTSAFKELKKLAELRTMGAITEEEFQLKKAN